MASSIRIACLLLAGFVIGCGQGGTPVPENTIPVTEMIRNDLKSIVSNNQLGSEMVTLDENLKKLAETEPEKAAELRKEYEKLEKSGGRPSGQAKKMMEKI
ncbi:hypothetical protein DTL21_13600 [Bremerella cremea]|uniref:Uncharacterized protein n=1 Tax=Blastopirellula marina TaxID=124 RepID=A0A2S8FQT7_9BACT|nr:MULTISPECIES: hypothetical protein [Pirellulaceae]PQO34546.1 hypothetical protein C5Y83_13595 [Blastopirellula marina]RCS47042.1 hypothetical protein DTL21_13600 [Bremerella cremea]